MKIYSTILLVSLLPLAFADKPFDLTRSLSSVVDMVSSYFKPAASKTFCKDIECPPYYLRLRKDDYELRCYNATKWVKTSGPLSSGVFGSATRTLFMRLFKYITGANDDGVKIEMTAPVRIVRPLNGREIGEGDMKMSFWVPPKFQLKTPIPTNQEVGISVEKERCFYVHPFGGYVLFKFQYMKHLNMLMDLLEKDQLGSTYDKSNFIFSGYDDPRKIRGRHNEIWLERL